MNSIAIVMDCGATNAAVLALDETGTVLASASRANAPLPQPGGSPGWLIWDLEQVWGKLAEACREVCSAIPRDAIKAVAVTTFGADGAPIRHDGTLAYPVISWQCNRTQPQAEEVAAKMDPWEIYQETGYQILAFNTLLRLMWLKKQAPDALDQAHCWLMMPGLLSHRLCGEFSIDPTIGSTTMAMNIAKRAWSPKMLVMAGVDSYIFPRWVEPGEVGGRVHTEASRQTGLPQGIPVVAAGHDTQFAAVGSGASPGEAILSSGTWEILMVRSDRFTPDRAGFEDGLIVECDAVKGFWNPQMLMMASGVLEWVRKHFYGGAGHEQMIADAQQVEPGAGGVTVLPSFVAGAGPTKRFGTLGTILGLTITTSPGQIYRAALEGLSFQLRQALEILERATGARPASIRVVGGGSRNSLWNQIRADATGLPVTAIAQKEATVLGAALFAFVGGGVFSSLEEALQAVRKDEEVFVPSPARHRYSELFQSHRQVAPSLMPFYSPE
jgi:L-fuculokinase